MDKPMDKTALRAAQAQRDAEARRLNGEAAKRYLTKRSVKASSGLIREALATLTLVVVVTTVVVIALAM
jgi:hypothetical protein